MSEMIVSVLIMAFPSTYWKRNVQCTTFVKEQNKNIIPNFSTLFNGPYVVRPNAV